MARLKERLAEAAAAIATLDELAGRTDLSLVERDSAILQLVYTFEAIWKAAALRLENRERIAKDRRGLRSVLPGKSAGSATKMQKRC
jgi:hypothetical protein